jgi:hypothetical protein
VPARLEFGSRIGERVAIFGDGMGLSWLPRSQVRGSVVRQQQGGGRPGSVSVKEAWLAGIDERIQKGHTKDGTLD